MGKQASRELACRELHQRMRLSFRRRRFICGGNRRKQQKVSLVSPEEKRPGEGQIASSLQRNRFDVHSLMWKPGP